MWKKKNVPTKGDNFQTNEKEDDKIRTGQSSCEGDINNTLNTNYDNNYLEHLKEQLWNRLENDIEKSNVPQHKIGQWKAVIKIAAMLVVLLGSSYALLYILKTSSAGTKNIVNLVEYKNKTTTDEIITLSDSSRVILKPGASIRYAWDTANHKREVQLSGTAFFDIAKKAANPFFVYTKNITAQVIGTSFWIKDGITPSVEVKTGAVAVYNKISVKEAKVIVRRNEKVILNNDTLLTTTADVPFASENKSDAFVFKATPLKIVTEKLTEAYGIEIIIADTILQQRKFTGNISDLDFYKQLDIICRSVNASYKKMETKIIIQN